MLTTSPIAVVEPPARSAPTSTSPVLTPTRMRTGTSSSDGHEVERLLHPQGGPDGPLGVVLVGDRRAEQGDDGVADDLVDPAAEGIDVGDEPLEAAVDQVLDLLRVHRLGQRGVPDEVREEDRHDPTLVSPQAQVLSALRAEASACRHVRTTAGAGHHRGIYRGRLVPPSHPGNP